MKFYLLMKQAGEGCDYTIGCALNWKVLKATTRIDARFEVSDLIREYTDERTLESAELLAVAESSDVDVRSIYLALEAEIMADAEILDRARRKAEYERLKREFERDE